MQLTRRRLQAALTSAAAVAVLGVVPAAPAAHAAAAAQTCYSHTGTYSNTYRYQAAYRTYPSSGHFTTTSYCNDINIWIGSNGRAGAFLDVCVVFIAHTDKCNNGDSYTTHGAGWSTIATDVKDGTQYTVRIHGYDSDADGLPFKIAS